MISKNLLKTNVKCNRNNFRHVLPTASCNEPTIVLLLQIEKRFHFIACVEITELVRLGGKRNNGK